MTPQNPVIKVFDSGIQSGARNLMIDRELLRRHADGRWPDTLRFHRSRPTACVGYHQAIDRELRLDYCAGHGIETARRVTGGGALYFDENQQGISLIVGRRGGWNRLSCARLLQLFCEALAVGLRELGLQAAYKFPNDLKSTSAKSPRPFWRRTVIPYCSRPFCCWTRTSGRCWKRFGCRRKSCPPMDWPARGNA